MLEQILPVTCVFSNQLSKHWVQFQPPPPPPPSREQDVRANNQYISITAHHLSSEWWSPWSSSSSIKRLDSDEIAGELVQALQCGLGAVEGCR
ncbi:hypothetical protein E2C01_044357 [Portunus trituberculatus]|uniref:Uncharacterized protein n=1 Tax=Portunus trituberculatus TaxID=210409 RepID=A0A5B7G080_PORTR|nr:hypothetical protein [Portunus trituberculatus]